MSAVCRCLSEYFCGLLDERSVRLLRIFGRLATSGKIHMRSKLFCGNGSHCGLLESQSLRHGFVKLSRLIYVKKKKHKQTQKKNIPFDNSIVYWCAVVEIFVANLSLPKQLYFYVMFR